jgi:hypothetical protein
VLRIEQKELKSTPVLENPVALAFSAVSWRNREASPELSRRIVLCRKRLTKAGRIDHNLPTLNVNLILRGVTEGQNSRGRENRNMSHPRKDSADFYGTLEHLGRRFLLLNGRSPDLSLNDVIA